MDGRRATTPFSPHERPRGGAACQAGEDERAVPAARLACATGPPPNGSTLTVIIPVHEAGEAFRRCLSSVRSACPAPDEVIVVVDGEADVGVALAGQGDIQVVRAAVRGGPARARNLGARAARGDILLFIDADVAIPPLAVAEVLRLLRTGPEVSALIGSYDDAPAELNFLSQYKNLFHHYTHQTAREDGFTFWGACGAVRREVFLAAGGFDETYRHPSVEDIELGYRLRAAGHRIRVCKQLQVKHLKRWTVGSLFRTDFFRRAVPWTRLILAADRMEDDLNISRSGRVKVALAWGLAGTLALSAWWRGGLALTALLALTLLVLDLPLLRFFRAKRGALFALQVIPWQWFYYVYSGLGFAVGMVGHALRSGPEARRPKPAGGGGSRA